METESSDYARMAGRPQNAPRKPPERATPRFIGQWIRALGHVPSDLAKAGIVNEGYLSELINDKKKNPSGAKLYAIADFLKIPMHYLYRPVPMTLEEARDLDPAVVTRLLTKRRAPVE